LGQQLTEQQKGDEDEEDRGTEEIQTKDFTDILAAIQGVPGVKVSTLGFNARADAESKTTYIHGPIRKQMEDSLNNLLEC